MAQPSEQPKQSFYVGKPDDKYKVLSRPIGLDVSTSNFVTKIIDPSNGVSRTQIASTTLYYMSNNQLDFEFSVPPTLLMDWDNSAVELSGYIAEADGTEASLTSMMLPWNLLLKVFRGVNIDFNNTRVYSKSNDDYFKVATLKNITEKSREELEQASFVFSPVGDEVYSTSIQSTSSAIGTVAGSLVTIRNNNWIPSAADTRVQKMCSFKDMFFSMPGLSKNLRHVKFNFELNPTTGTSTATNAIKLGNFDDETAKNAYFFPHTIRLHVKQVQPSPSSSAIGLADKVNQEAEHLCFIDPELRNFVYSDSMTVTSQENVQWVAVLQFADIINSATATNTYNNCGQFQLLNGYSKTGVAANTVLLRSDRAPTGGDCHSPPSSIQINYAGINYPSNPLDLRNKLDSSLIEHSQLYLEFKRTVQQLGISQPSITEDIFKRTMPMALFKIAPNKLIQSSDIVVSLPDGTYSASVANTATKKVDVVYGKLKSFNLAPSGTVSSVEPTF